VAITLPVRSVVNSLVPPDGRVMHLYGVLYLRGDDFRLIQAEEVGTTFDESIFLRIEDTAALSKLGEVYRTKATPDWWFFEEALVSGRVRQGAAGRELYEVHTIDVLLGGDAGRRSIIHLRGPHPHIGHEELTNDLP
jgi:hypothetical protein